MNTETTIQQHSDQHEYSVTAASEKQWAMYLLLCQMKDDPIRAEFEHWYEREYVDVAGELVWQDYQTSYENFDHTLALAAYREGRLSYVWEEPALWQYLQEGKWVFTDDPVAHRQAGKQVRALWVATRHADPLNPLVLPEAQESKPGDDAKELGYVEGWNACREAMLEQNRQTVQPSLPPLNDLMREVLRNARNAYEDEDALYEALAKAAMYP